MFWENFLANFLSDVLIIILFGGGTYFLFHNKINQKIDKVVVNLGNVVGDKMNETIKQKIEQITTKGDNININRINIDNRTVEISGAKDSSVTQPEEGIENILKNL